VLGGVKFTKKPCLTNVYPNNKKKKKKKKNNKVKSKPLELFELAGKNLKYVTACWTEMIAPPAIEFAKNGTS
jgi:hypothetical protein